MELALTRQLGKKPKALALNLAALQAGKQYAAEHLTKRDPYRVERLNKTAGQILIEGNAAAAMGCMFAGVTVVAWYPITPSSSLPESLIRYMRKYRMDKETGQGDVRHRAGRGRDRVARHGHWRQLGGRAGDDVHVRARDFADVGVRRAGVLRGSAGRGLRHPARRALHGAADAHRAGRHPVRRAELARRYAACPAPARLGRGVLRRWRWTRSIWPSACRRSSSC